MTDRPVNLDLGMSSQLDSQAQRHSQARREDAHAGLSHSDQKNQILQDAARLEELLADTSDSSAPAVPDAEQQAALVPRPTDLFAGRLSLSREPEPANLNSCMQAQQEDGHAVLSHSGQENQTLQDAARLKEHHADTSDSSAPAVPDAEQQAALLPRPTDLFAGGVPQSQEAEPANSKSPMLVTELEENIAHMARTLMVSQGTQGVTTVRIELGREQLPGVILEVFRNEGTLVAQFICANEQSHARLTRVVSWLGESLSGRLKNDTLIRVQTDDPEDPLPVEVRHRATPV